MITFFVMMCMLVCVLFMYDRNDRNDYIIFAVVYVLTTILLISTEIGIKAIKYLSGLSVFW